MLTLENVCKRYKGHQVLVDVSFRVGAGEIVGLVGRSGSGKSTIAKCVLGLERPDSGRISWRNAPLSNRAAGKAAARQIQMVFQDPRSSLNPRWTVHRALSEPLDNCYGREPPRTRETKLRRLLDQVALASDVLGRHPHELSTGQCQRVCVARALAPEPDLLVLDEPLSALDVSVQARLIDLLLDLHRTAGISYLLITHDFSVVAEMCQRIVVLDRGQVVEAGEADRVLAAPSHGCTRALLQDVLPLPA